MSIGCVGCKDGNGFEQPFSMAFQPIVNLKTGKVFAQEALVRGKGGEGAGTVLSAVTEVNRYAFDQACRVRAIELAHGLNILDGEELLSINIMPNAIYEPRACIRQTLIAAERTGLPPDRIIFEFTESEKLKVDHLRGILRAYREIGFKTAIDDFGAGFSGLLLLAEMQPDIVKLDMGLIRGIDSDPVKQTMLQHISTMLNDLGVMAVCEGVETLEELEVIRRFGISLIQGYLVARPSFETMQQPVIQAAMAV